VDSVRVAVRDSCGGISDRAKERDKERGDGGFRMVPEAKATALDGVVGEEVRKSRDVRWEISGCFEEECGGVVECSG
jgi:hypothetical protein